MDSIELKNSCFRDLPRIIEIEKMCFVSPWSSRTFASCLVDRNCINISAGSGRNLAGYCICHETKKMIHILNLAVHPDFRRRGIARKMVDTILEHAVEKGIDAVYLEVREGNEAAKSLYSSLDFKYVCTWHNYYTDTSENAEIMVWKIGDKLK